MTEIEHPHRANIVINSVRKHDLTEEQIRNLSYKPERTGDALAGHKHHVTKPFLDYLKQETMTMCQENSLYQVDLLSPAKVRITDREYWAKRNGQARLDAENEEKIRNGIPESDIKEKVYKTNNDFLRDAIYAVLKSIIPAAISTHSANPSAHGYTDYAEATDDLYQRFCDKDGL